MIKRILVLVSGTLTGLISVLVYNPPHLAGALSTSLPTAPLSEPLANSSPLASQGKSTATSQETIKTTKKTKPSDPVLDAQASGPQTLRDSVVQNDQGLSVQGTFEGNSVATKYGPVRVRIVVSAGQIVSAEGLEYPTRDRRSLQISQAVIPWLQQETLRIQLADVMAVSGATVTTSAWNRSLSSALQKAGM